MSNQRFDLGKIPHISVANCAGDLVVRSWLELDVVVKGDAFEANETEAGLSLVAHGDLQLMVPEGTHLSVENAHGDVVVKNINGDVNLHEIHGDAVLLGLSHIKVGTIHSDLSAKNIDGAVGVETINGDAAFRNVGGLHVATVHGDIAGRYINGPVDLGEAAGDVSLNTVNADLNIGNCHRDANLQNLGGMNTVAHVAGDIRLGGSLISGDHRFTADGDILMRWPVEAPLNLTANAPNIKNRLPLDNIADKDGTLLGTIGDGKTNVNLTANGRILLKEARMVKAEWEAFATDGMDMDFTLDLAGLGEEIASKVNEQVTRVTAELESRFGPDFSQRIAEKAERAASQAEKAAEKAIRKFEVQIERAAKRQSRSGRMWTPPTPPTPSQPKKSTAEEQLKILKMVENGTISPDEAAMLLSALDS